MQTGLSEYVDLEREEIASLERHVWAKMWTLVYLQILNFTLGAIGSCIFLSDTMSVAQSTERLVS